MPQKNLKKLFGVSMIEFAIILPVLLLVLIGIIDISVLLYDKIIITNASREGARYGVMLRQPTYASSASVVAYTQTYLSNSLISFSSSAPAAIVTATPSTPIPQFGSTLNVNVTYVYTDLLLHHFINHSPEYTLNSTTIMSYE
ncbi:MAG TPA: TadE family protein [Parachlamydiaceae bacterium]|nr:TadE family protein [Parachlamydiaceae bacterium]